MPTDPTTLLDADGLTKARLRLVDEVASDGHRLGLIVLDCDQPAIREATAVLEAASLLPLRRLAKLQPRHGEEDVRIEDIIDFVEHYGHEYVAAALPTSAVPSAADRANLETACSLEGCDLLWHSSAL